MAEVAPPDGQLVTPCSVCGQLTRCGHHREPVDDSANLITCPVGGQLIGKALDLAPQSLTVMSSACALA